jgi:hypothetical protein
MRPRRTHESTGVLHLPGGNEDNDLWFTSAQYAGTHVFLTVWEFTPEERRRIMDGENLELMVLGEGHPPVQLSLTTVELGKG